jgi:hypothetical protein
MFIGDFLKGKNYNPELKISIFLYEYFTNVQS